MSFGGATQTVAFLAALLLACAPAGYAQIPGTSAADDRPNFTVQIWGNSMAAFSARIETYLTLRHSLEEGLPPLTVTSNPADIGRAERMLARRIRIARAGAMQGDLFTPDVGADFRRVLLLEADRPDADGDHGREPRSVLDPD